MKIVRIYNSACEQSNAINCAADKTAKREDMAQFYADCIVAERKTGDAWAKAANYIRALK